MRHRVHVAKLGRSAAHRSAMLANMVCSLIEEKRIITTLSKAKLVRQLAEKMVTLAKSGTLADRRAAIASLRRPDCVGTLFKDIAPVFKERAGGYTRIIKLNKLRADSSEMAILEWVGIPAPDKTKPPEVKEAAKKKA